VIHYYQAFIIDEHSFRQTQTAITAKYLLIDRAVFAYTTPVLGAPWAIPMEFPTYQIFAALLYLATGLPWEVTGRIVSYTFFVLSWIVVLRLLEFVKMELKYRLVVLAVYILHPTYLFWSRTFMIETTALFFTLLFLQKLIEFSCERTARNIIVVTIVGIVAAVTKVTTFIPALILLVLYLIVFKRNYLCNRMHISRAALEDLFIIVVPCLFALIWVHYTDNIKLQNPLGASLTSAALSGWNWGTWGQRLDYVTWEKCFEYARSYYLFLFMPIFIAIILYSEKKTYFTNTCNRLVFVCLVGYLSGPLLFTNLYFRHNYYWAGNTVYLTVAIGILVAQFLNIIDHLLISATRKKLYSGREFCRSIVRQIDNQAMP